MKRRLQASFHMGGNQCKLQNYSGTTNGRKFHRESCVTEQTYIIGCIHGSRKSGVHFPIRGGYLRIFWGRHQLTFITGFISGSIKADDHYLVEYNGLQCCVIDRDNVFIIVKKGVTDLYTAAIFICCYSVGSCGCPISIIDSPYICFSFCFS